MHVYLATDEFAVDLGRVSRCGKTYRPLLVTSITDLLQLKYTGLKCSRVLCVRDVQLFCVVFCVVRALHKFDFRVVINEKPKNGERWKGCNAVIETLVFDRISIFSPHLHRVC
jgi:hypothetical protein